MVTRAPFLKTRYGGYHHRQVPLEELPRSRLGLGEEQRPR